MGNSRLSDPADHGRLLEAEELLKRAVGILDNAGDAGLERLPTTLDQLAKAYFAATRSTLRPSRR